MRAVYSHGHRSPAALKTQATTWPTTQLATAPTAAATMTFFTGAHLPSRARACPVNNLTQEK
jgi:hypothetical protein